MTSSLRLFPTIFTAGAQTLAKSSSATPPPLSAMLANTQRSVRLVSFVASAKPTATAEPKKRDGRGIMKPRRVSPEMQEFLGGVSEISRTQLLKAIWAHIKENNLQDPADKKVIVCDEKLKKVFGGRERVGFLEIAGLITPHLLK